MYMRRAKACLLAMMICLGPAPASADQTPYDACEDPSVPQRVFNDLIGWIALHTMYDVKPLANHLPEIVFCTKGERISYEGLDIPVEEGLRAVYDLSHRRVFLVRPWSADNPLDRSVLLHELVHIVQLDGRTWPCTGAPELEAYMLQDQYLKEYGIDAGFDWGAIFLLSICPPEGD